MEHLCCADGAGRHLPESSEAPTAGTARGLKDQQNREEPKYATDADDASIAAGLNSNFFEGACKAGDAEIAHAADAKHKTLATLQARAALAGYRLDHLQPQGGAEVFVVSRWSYERRFDDLEQVAALLDRVGGDYGR